MEVEWGKRGVREWSERVRNRGEVQTLKWKGFERQGSVLKWSKMEVEWDEWSVRK